MSRVSELIDLIVQGKNTEATEVLNQELLNRSYEGINDMKPQVANDYFASVIDMPNDGQPLEYHNDQESAEEPTNETD
tara:strand:+ start:590 stop:823 length:234 start_codon:yes stop_codon:yes gene_type:complete